MPKTLRSEIRQLRDAYSRDPEGRAFIQLADAHRRSGDLDQAHEVLRQGLRHHPADTGAHAVLAQVMEQQGDRTGADAAWRRVLDLAPDDAHALRALGRSARDAGRSAEALEHFHRLLTLQEDVEVQRMIAELTETAETAEAAAPEAQPGRNGRTAAAEAAPEAPAAVQVVAVHSANGAGAAPASGADAVALVEVLVRALEHQGAVFRPESSLTRLLAVALGRELELRDEHLNALALAALLSDLGGLALGGGDDDPRRQAAVTLQLLGGVSLPAGVHEALAHQHEHWDGSGSPDGLAEERIPFPARILAVARGYARLVADGDGREPLPAPAAIDEMQRQAGSVYDPVVASLLRRVFAARERHGIGYGWGGQIFIAHPEELRGLGLATRLHSAGYVTQTAGGVAGVRERMRDGAVQALVLGARLADGDAAALIQEIRASAQLRAVPVLVIDADSPDQRISLLSAGADVCFAPDVSFTEFKATLDAFLRRSELVSGSAAPAAPYARSFA